MSLGWWSDYYFNNDTKKTTKINFEHMFNEIKFLKIQLEVFKAKIDVLDKEYKKKNKLT
jgi:hypothetical protein